MCHPPIHRFVLSCLSDSSRPATFFARVVFRTQGRLQQLMCSLSHCLRCVRRDVRALADAGVGCQGGESARDSSLEPSNGCCALQSQFDRQRKSEFSVASSKAQRWIVDRPAPSKHSVSSKLSTLLSLLEHTPCAAPPTARTQLVDLQVTMHVAPQSVLLVAFGKYLDVSFPLV